VGSSAATAAITEDDEDGNEDNDKRLDKRFADNFDGIDWSRLPLYCKHVATQKQHKSWIYPLYSAYGGGIGLALIRATIALPQQL
jgi:hypothetical protein